MAGAFQTSRDIFSSPIWKNIVDFRMFFLIYGNAVFAEEGFRLSEDLTLQRGQWCRSTRKLQEDLVYIENRQIKKYSTSVINRCIKRLVDMHMICTKTHELGTVFTVVNYAKYQGFESYRTANLEQNLEHSGNSGGTLGEQSGNNNKNVNNDNNVKEEDIKISGAEAPKRKKFIVPTLEEVAAYCYERGSLVDPIKWYDYYTSNGWRVGKNPMKDWKAAVRTWERTNKKGGDNGAKYGSSYAVTQFGGNPAQSRAVQEQWEGVEVVYMPKVQWHRDYQRIRMVRLRHYSSSQRRIAGTPHANATD